MRQNDGLNNNKTSVRPFLCMIILVIILVLVASFLYKNMDGFIIKPDTAEAAETEESSQDSFYNQEEVRKEEAEVTDTEVELSAKTEESYATSHQEGLQVALTDAPVRISDVYAEEDSIVIFHCFYPDAVKYSWETYDMETKDWIIVSPEDTTSGSDELYRDTSSFWTTATKEHDELMVRCTIDFTAKESITDTATLYVLEKHISDISAEDFIAASGQYVNSKDIPINITYSDGSQDVVTGLNGIHFLETEESSEYSTTVSGNAVETITTIITACEYSYIELQEKEAILRYQNEDSTIDVPVKLIGKDLLAPDITDLKISDFEISNIDRPVTVAVTIQAEDNDTPYPNLEYAFLLSGQEPKEKDWVRKSYFDVDINQNGTWVAYCRDQSGNIASVERDIIVVDNKAPIVSLQLENDLWCQTNKIIVNATDGLSLEYCYSCAETGDDSGWSTRNEYDIQKNGTWKVKVRDAAGNVTEQEITINNIDNQMPVIRKITEIEGGITSDEKN